MNPEIQEQIKRINNFNENESIKMIEIRKFLSSKTFLLLIILLIVGVGFYTGIYMAENIIYYINNNIEFHLGHILSFFGDAILNSVLNIIFIVISLGIYKWCKSNKPSTDRDNLAQRLFKFRSFAKFFYIITIISYISTGLTYISYDTIVINYPELVQDLFMGLDKETIKNLGINCFIDSGLLICIWYSLSNGTKKMLRSIVFDSTDEKYIEILIFIGFNLIYGILHSIGISLSLVGIVNPLTSIYFVEPIIFTDFLHVIYESFNLMIIVIISIIFFTARKILMIASGSTNPFIGDEVYTVNLEDDND